MSECENVAINLIVEFFIFPHRKKNMAWNNTILLVVPSSISSKFQHLNTKSNHIDFSQSDYKIFIISRIRKIKNKSGRLTKERK